MRSRENAHSPHVAQALMFVHNFDVVSVHHASVSTASRHSRLSNSFFSATIRRA
jgi:hypothetical protein